MLKIACGRDWGTPQKFFSVKLISVSTKVRTGYLRNTSQLYYLLSQFALYGVNIIFTKCCLSIMRSQQSRNGRFIIVFKICRHWFLSWAISFQSAPSHPSSSRFILILYSHLRLGLPNFLWFYRPTIFACILSLSHMLNTLPIPSALILIIKIIFF